MVFTLGSCGSKGVDFNSLKENMMSADDSLPSMKTVSDKSENAETLFKSLSDFDYSGIESFFLAYASDGSPYEIAAVKLKDAGDLEKLETTLNNHIGDRVRLYKNYAPEYAKKAEKAIVISKDNIAALIMSDKSDEVKKAFEKSFKML